MKKTASEIWGKTSPAFLDATRCCEKCCHFSGGVDELITHLNNQLDLLLLAKDTQIAEAEKRGREEERKQWKEANELLRSTHSIAERKGKEVNWDGFLNRINEELKREHIIMYPENYVGMHENPAEMDVV